MTDNSDKPVVIVTGSSGYIGSAIVKKLAARYRVIGFDRDAAPHPPAEAECVCVDVTDQASIDAAFERVRTAYGKRIASFVHLAAYFDLTGEPNPKYDAVTVKGTGRLLDALQDFEIDQFVFVSTMLAHAPIKGGGLIDETSPLDTDLPYRESKVRTEQLIREKRGDIDAVFVRPAGVYDDEGHSAFLAQQVARIYEKRPSARVYPGDLDTGQPYLHLEDLLDGIERIVDRRSELPSEWPVLLGEDDVMSYGELQKSLGRLIHDEDWTTRTVPKGLAKTGAWVENEVLGEETFIRPWMVDISDDHYELDLSNARERLDWTPQHRLRTALPRIVEGLKADPSAWYAENKLNAARVAGSNFDEADEAEPAPLSEDALADHAGHMRKMHFNMLWVHWFTMLLGLWLATTPFVFGTFDQSEFTAAVTRITEDRDLWDPALRSSLTAWNDVVSGVLIMIFAAISLSPRGGWAQWTNTCIGIWLLGAPLVFWTPDAAVYANDTFIGALVIAFTILVPMMPGMAPEGMMDDSDVPPGWTYSPSTYVQRMPIIILGAVGFFLSRILTAYQLGHIDGVWEPFFASPSALNGTEYIITSDVSKAWPIADGGLGAMSYMFEILMGVMGSRRRWRTMPWMVALFGIVVGPLGVVSIYFIISQPIVIGTWSTLALIAALAMLIMIPFSLDEVIAMGQYLYWSRKEGKPLVRTFFKGGAVAHGEIDDTDYMTDARSIWNNTVRGVTFPWTLMASTALGAWLMLTRITLGSEGAMANSDHVVGALVITVAIIATAEVARTLRFINAAFGAWLVAAPFLLAGASSAGTVASVAVGLLLIGLSLPQGKRSGEHYAGWDRFVM